MGGFALIVIIFIVLAIIDYIGKAKRAEEQRRARSGTPEAYTASSDEIKRFLRGVGMPSQEETDEDQGEAEPMEPRRPAERRRMTPAGQIAPTARRQARAGWPPPPPSAAQEPEPWQEEEQTHRLLTENERLSPTIEDHLRQVHLEERETSYDSLEAEAQRRGRGGRRAPISSDIEAAPAASVAPEAETVGSRRAPRGEALISGLGKAAARRAIVLAEVFAPPLTLRDPKSDMLRRS